MNICLSSAGRRVALMGAFRDALSTLTLPGRVSAVDCSLASAAYHSADAAWTVPLCRDPEFIPRMLELCRHEAIQLVVPTIDTELPMYAKAREDFSARGVAVAVSRPEVIEISADKTGTHAWLVSHGFPTVRQASLAEVLAAPDEWQFPLIVKPARGSAGIGVQRVDSREALSLCATDSRDMVVQELAPGAEYTTNCYVNRAGKCLCTVPHRRLEVRAGEISKGVTRKHPGLMDLARRIAETLPGAYGAITVQAFLADDDTIRVIEINPRFGGGYPLSHAAGADFPRWLIQEALGQTVDTECTDWRDNLAMLRYDDAVFVDGREIGVEWA